MKRLYTVRLTSDDVSAEHQFHLSPATVVLLFEVAAAFNAKARFSVDPRMFVEPSASAATQGEVA